jgi:hypothetical protein
MRKIVFLFSISLLPFSLISQAAMTSKQLYAASMENDAQFIECVGNVFFAVANFQRVILEDLKWEDANSEYQKITKSKESLKKASTNLSAALINSDRLLSELSGDKKKKFETQLGGFKSQVKDLNSRLEKVIAGIDQKQLPKVEDIHQLLSLAIAGTGFGMNVSKKNAAAKAGH